MNLAIAAVNSSYSSGPPVCIYIPKGTYLFNSNPNTFTGPGCVIGDGPLKTIVKTGPSLTTSVFSWTDAWEGAAGGTGFPFNGATVNIPSVRAGPILSGLSIIGNRTYAQQTAIAFDGHEDFGLIQNVDVFYVNGSAFRTGVPAPGGADAYTRESRLVNFRAFNSGKAGAPVIDLGTLYNGGDTTNANTLLNIDIYAPYGVGIHIAPRTRYIDGNLIRVEGLENNPANIQGDLIQVGDPGSANSPNSIHLKGLNLVDPYVNYAALHVAGTSSAQAYDYSFDGSIGGGAAAGNGLQLDVGQESIFRFPANNVNGTELILGSALSPVLIEAGGSQGQWSVTNNSSFALASFFPSAFTNNATGTDSLAFGTGSTAGNSGGIALGVNNIAGQPGSVILGGTGANDRGRPTWQGSGSSPYFQFGKIGIFGTTSGTASIPVRSSYGGGPCITTDNTTHGFKVSIVARDITNVGNVFYWSIPAGVLSRGTGAGSTVFAAQPSVSGGLGTGVGAGAFAGADTTGGCLYVGFNPPSGNTDTWHVGGTVETSEVQ
jgi:hypothetical protein